MDRPHFACPFVYNGHMGGIHLWVMLNNTAVNMGVQISPWVPLPTFFFVFARCRCWKESYTWLIWPLFNVATLGSLLVLFEVTSLPTSSWCLRNATGSSSPTATQSSSLISIKMQICPGQRPPLLAPCLPGWLCSWSFPACSVLRLSLVDSLEFLFRTSHCFEFIHIYFFCC